LHIHGNYTSTLPHVSRNRTDGVDVEEPTDWTEAASILGPLLCLKCNIDALLRVPGEAKGLRTSCETINRIAMPDRSRSDCKPNLTHPHHILNFKPSSDSSVFSQELTCLSVVTICCTAA
jgi:hypothetical protein